MQRRDADELRTALAHDIEWTLPEGVPWGGTRHGPDGIDSLIDIFKLTWRGLRRTPTTSRRTP